MTANATTRLPLAQRLAKIMGSAAAVPKRGRVRSSSAGGPSYNFAQDPDVLATVRKPLADEGIILLPNVELIDDHWIERDGRAPMLLVTIKVTWQVTDGEESLTFSTFGQGSDTGDKAMPKAQTNARKYALLQLFQLVTGDDPEATASASDEEPARVRQGATAALRDRARQPHANGSGGYTSDDWSRLFGAARQRGMDADAVRIRAADLYNVSDLGQLTRPQFEELIAAVGAAA